jgi:hypothetical protein
MSQNQSIYACPKIKLWRSEQYLKWVSRKASYLSGKMDYDEVIHEGRTIYHHFGHDGGKAIKCSDIYVVPVTAQEHRDIEDGIIIPDEMQQMICAMTLLNEYLVEKGIK